MCVINNKSFMEIMQGSLSVLKNRWIIYASVRLSNVQNLKNLKTQTTIFPWE